MPTTMKWVFKLTLHLLYLVFNHGYYIPVNIVACQDRWSKTLCDLVAIFLVTLQCLKGIYPYFLSHVKRNRIY